MLDSVVALGSAALYVAFLWSILRARPALFFSLLWLLLPMSWRVVDALYIDLLGPVFADQLNVHVGPGSAAGLLILDLVAALAVFCLILPAPRMVEDNASTDRPMAWTMNLLRYGLLICVALLLAGVYIEVLMIGVVPVLSGIERYDYAESYAGPLYRFLLRFGDPLVMYLGGMAVLPVFSGRKVDTRFVYLLVAILILAFLTGHRFSAFFKFCALFAIAFAAHSLSRQRGLSESGGPQRALLLLFVTALIIVIPAILLSYFSTRFDDPSDALHSIGQRTLIQQAELWWSTNDRVVNQGVWGLSHAFTQLFVSPIDPSRNTTIQYLMELSLGDDAERLINQNTQYAGGFPEILHEAFGPAQGVFFAAALAVPAAFLLRIFLLSVVEARPLTMLTSGMLLYPFQIMFWGGMLNFLQAWSFWAKLMLFLLAWAAESHAAKQTSRRIAMTLASHQHESLS